MAIRKGCKVKVEYTGKLQDGTIFDKTENGEPLEFVIGENKIIPEFEQTVESMEVGQTKTIFISCENAYGSRDETLIRRFQKNILPDNITPYKGMDITLHLPNGGVLPAKIVGITELDIIVDLNHPLAGQDLIFEIKLVHIENNLN